ncbi:MAG: hypothetical protein KME32_10895 [Mojavia pulchra JT2-VF2]|uniref:Uncharacterized protein n=1 Tax=Mojavia pulchra JT2-VF2 TaxID=287848 RepID=A0A951PZ89_9NOST|nr:hypothetical protein [Mojavia pulchra JT2-VF2]
MSNDKPLRVYALFLRFSARRSLILLIQAMSNDKPLRVYALFLRYSVRRSLFHNRRSLTLPQRRSLWEVCGV